VSVLGADGSKVGVDSAAHVSQGSFARAMRVAQGLALPDTQSKIEGRSLDSRKVDLSTPLGSAQWTIKEMQARAKSVMTMCSGSFRNLASANTSEQQTKFGDLCDQLEELYGQLNETDPSPDHKSIWENLATLSGKLEIAERELRVEVTAEIGGKQELAKDFVTSRCGNLPAVQGERNKLDELVEKLGKLCTGAKPDMSLKRLGKISKEIDEINHQLRKEMQMQVVAQNFKSKALELVRPHEVGKKISFLQAREACGRLAQDMAHYCINKDGTVNRPAVEMLHKFLANKENFQGEPWSKFPFFEHMRFQAFCVTRHLLKSSEFQNVLNESNGTQLGSNGLAMQEAMSFGQTNPMQPSNLILASLFSPHRQSNLPTCTINSWINNMIFNDPEQLAKMYAAALAEGSFQTPSGHCITPPQIANGHITVDLKDGEDGKRHVFRDISTLRQTKTKARIKKWEKAGITYNSAEKHKLGLPAQDLNDLCFAGIFQATFGNGRINWDTEYGTMHVLAGFPLKTVDAGLLSHQMHINKSGDIPRLITKLKQEAKVQQKNGANYMRIYYLKKPKGGHAFNVNVAELLSLDIGSMKLGEIRSIGDLNWKGSRCADIPRMAIRRTAKGFELGKASHAESQNIETTFKQIDIAKVGVYKTEVRQQQQPAVAPQHTTHPQPVDLKRVLEECA
jgi:hypothetical protein